MGTVKISFEGTGLTKDQEDAIVANLRKTTLTELAGLNFSGIAIDKLELKLNPITNGMIVEFRDVQQ